MLTPRFVRRSRAASAWRRTGRRPGVGLGPSILFGCCLSLLACAPGASTEERGAEPISADAVVVASFNFPESVLLAEIYAGALEDAGVAVSRRHQVGPREIMEPALEQGLVDVVPEYLGSALASLDGGAAATTLEADDIRARLVTILDDRGVLVLTPSPAANQNGIVVTPQTAARLDLRSISDLAPHAERLTFGGPRECPDRPLCLAGLEGTYELAFASFLPLDSGGRQTRAALTSGEIDVGLLFSTDGHLTQGDFVLLDDDRRLQPAENVVPFVRRQVAERWGDALVDRLDAVSAALSTEALAELNAEVGIEAEPPAEVAADWLEDEGLGSD